MKKRVVIVADKGMILTNGEIYGKTIYLADTDAPENYTEITQEEYYDIIAEEDKKYEAN